MTSRLGKRKIRSGVVVGDKMNKTVVVAVQTMRPHRLYKKLVKRMKNYKVHDENNAFKIGDKVKIMETRPLSKGKRWRVIELVSKPRGVQVDDSNQHQS